ncbi:MAG: hypothetical protein U0176_13935 [Bacteroidia bacterium]
MTKNPLTIRPFSLLCLYLGLSVGAFAQNVGIGTSNPQERLHVAGELRVDGLAGSDDRVVTASTLGNLQAMLPGTAGQVLAQGVAGPVWQDFSAWNLIGNAGTTPLVNFIGTTDAQPLAFRTNNVEAMRVTPDGLVCINGTGPFASDRFSVYAAGNQSAVNGYAFGTGNAAYFANYGTQASLVSWASGTTGSAAQFVSAHTTTTSTQPTVYVYNGTAAAAGILLRSDLANNNAHGIQLDINGASSKQGIQIDMDAATIGSGEAILQYGLGHGLTIQSFNNANPLASLLSHQAGTGRAVEGISFLPTHTSQAAYFGQGSTGLVPATYANATAVWGQSGGIRGGAFLAAGGTASTTILQAVYNGPNGNYDAVGVIGVCAPNPTYGYGVVGQGNWYGVFANGNSGASGVKSFIIDHPSDPGNKYLRHFSIESPEVLNLYRGTVTCDASGFAEVTLPSYFNAVNADISYQLTPIGGAGQVFVASEVDGSGKFRIGGAAPGQKVCWVVYADRNDAFVRNNPAALEVEPEKRSDDRGLYLHPELYGQPEENGLFFRNRVRVEK